MENDIYTTKYGRQGNIKDSHVCIHKNLEIRYSQNDRSEKKISMRAWVKFKQKRCTAL